MESLTQPVQRDRLKKQLSTTLATSYDHDVMGVYFTDFVTQ
jgi:flagellar basal body-associated protein FliL